MAERDEGQQVGAERRLHAVTEILHRFRAVGLRERAAGGVADEGDGGPAFTGEISDQWSDCEYAGVREGVRVQSWAAHGEARGEGMQSLVKNWNHPAGTLLTAGLIGWFAVRIEKASGLKA